MKINIDKQIEEQLKRADAMLGGAPDAARKVMGHAINRALMAARTEGTRAVRDVYTVRASKIRDSMKIIKISPSSEYGEVEVKGSSLPLTAFTFSPKSYNRWTRPVRASVKKGSSKVIEGAFVASPNGAIQVYEHANARGTKIKRVQRLSAPQMMESDGVVDRMTARASDVLTQRFEHELQRELERRAK